MKTEKKKDDELINNLEIFFNKYLYKLYILKLVIYFL